MFDVSKIFVRLEFDDNGLVKAGSTITPADIEADSSLASDPTVELAKPTQEQLESIRAYLGRAYLAKGQCRCGAQNCVYCGDARGRWN